MVRSLTLSSVSPGVAFIAFDRLFSVLDVIKVADAREHYNAENPAPWRYVHASSHGLHTSSR